MFTTLKAKKASLQKSVEKKNECLAAKKSEAKSINTGNKTNIDISN